MQDPLFIAHLLERLLMEPARMAVVHVLNGGVGVLELGDAQELGQAAVVAVGTFLNTG